MTKLEQFLDAVRRMRWHQKEYFKTRDKYDLLDAKRFEGIVDNLLEEISNEQ